MDLLQLPDQGESASMTEQHEVAARGLDASNVTVSTQRREAGSSVVLRLWAEREGPFVTTFFLRLPGQEEEQQVHVRATVLSRKKGTPGLKANVHCEGFTVDTDTEAASDWAGFD